MSSEDRLARAERILDKLVEVALSTDERLDDSNIKIAALTDAQIKIEAILARLGEKMIELAESQAHTDRRLDALIDIVGGMKRPES